MDNHRSFSDVRIHIVLNYPLVALAVGLCILLAINWSRAGLTKPQKVFSVATVVAVAALIGLLVNWQFFKVIA